MKIRSEIINKIKDSVSIVEVIKQYLDLNKKGNNWFGCCPFHSEKTASFCVNATKKIYTCFSCREHGDVFSFLSKKNNISYYKAVLEVSKIANLNFALMNELNEFYEHENKFQYMYEINELANKYFQMFLQNSDNNALNYLQTRGLSAEIIKKFGIGYAPDDNNLIINLLTNKDNMVPGAKHYKLEELKNAGIASLTNSGEYISFFKNRIIFPIYNQYSQIVGFSGRTLDSNNEPKYLNTSQTEIFNKNEILYNFNEVSKLKDIYSLFLVEGFMDVIAMSQAGYNNAVATMGVAFSENHLDQLKTIDELSSIILAFDNDLAGELAIAKSSELIGNYYNVYMIQYLSDKYKDIDELLHNDKELCEKTINNIVHYYDYEIENLLNKTAIKNVLDKEHLLKKLILILNKYKHTDDISNQIKSISEKLGINENQISNKITSSNLKTSNKQIHKNLKKNTSNDFIELHANKKYKIELVKYTQKTEPIIIECCLLSRHGWELFFSKSGLFLVPENIALLSLIDNFYTKNPNKEFIEINDLKSMTNDSDQIAKLTSMLISLEKRKIFYAQEKLLNIIDTHLKQIDRYFWDSNYKNAINAKTEQERQKYYEHLDKLIKKKLMNRN